MSLAANEWAGANNYLPERESDDMMTQAARTTAAAARLESVQTLHNRRPS